MFKNKDKKSKILFENVEIDEDELDEYPETKGIIGYLLPLQVIFIWIIPLILKGFKNPIQVKDLTKLDKHYKCDFYENRFEKVWKFFKSVPFRLFFTLYTTFFFEFIFAQLLLLIYACLSVVIPLLLKFFFEELQPLLSLQQSNKFDFYNAILPPELGTPTDYYSIGYRRSNYMIWIYLVVLFIAQASSSIFYEYGNFHSHRVGRKFKSLISLKVYKKAFKLSSRARARNKRGKILSLVMTDCHNIGTYQNAFGAIWISIFTSFFAFFFLFQLLGNVIYVTLIVFGVIFFLLFVIMFGVLIARFTYLRAIEIRMNKMRESLQNMLFLKSFNLCGPFLKKIKKAREKELNTIRILLLIRGFCMALANSTPSLLTLSTFLVSYFYNENINIIELLTSLAYFKMLRVPLTSMGLALITIMFNFVSIKRLQNFLQEEEKKDNQFKKVDEKFEYSIWIQNLNFFWDDPIQKDKKADKNVEMKEMFLLRGINFYSKRGELVMISGKARSGKTSLLLSILGETTALEVGADRPEFIMNSNKIAYCSQTPFIFNESVLNNILIGKKYNKSLFGKVLRITSLMTDIDNMPGGVSLEIDENGRSISGGQKKRICLARALYYDADIYLLDDVFYGLDYSVGMEVFRKCILEHLKEKTVVLVTNSKALLRYADRVVYMDNGEIKGQGIFNELVKNNKKFSNFLGYEGKKKIPSDNDDDSSEETDIRIESDVTDKKTEGDTTETESDTTDTKTVESETTKTGESDLDSIEKIEIEVSGDEKAKEKKEIIEDITKQKERITIDEERVVGTISSKTLSSYLSFFWCGGRNVYGGLLMVFIIFLVYIFGMGMYFLTEIHISNLASLSIYHEKTGNMFNTSYYQNNTIGNNGTVLYGPVSYFDNAGSCPENCNCTEGVMVEIFWKEYSNGTVIIPGISKINSLIIYIVLVITSFLGLILQTFIFYICFINTSKKMFKRAISSLFGTHLRFFFANPIGRMISRLCQDIIESDYYIVFSLELFTTLGFFFVGCIAMIIIGTFGIFLPIAIIFIVFALIFYFIIRRSTIELKRVQSITRSSIIHHFNESLLSLSSIKSYNLSGKFVQEQKVKIDRNMCADRLRLSVMYLVGEYLTIGGYFFVFLIGIFSILIAYYSEISSVFKILELGISNTAMTASVLGAIFQYLIEIEVYFNSIERLDYYGNLPQEMKKERLLKIDQGSLKFEKFSMKYKDDFPVVLKDVSFEIKPNEKVIVVGKTGAGKSSLIWSILKLVKPVSGKIEIDNINIDDVHNDSIRNEISLIPQEVFVFDATIRENINPTMVKSDNELWEVISKFEMKPIIEQLGGLDKKINKSLSDGEKRLIALLRAIVKQSKIILIDESSNLDFDFIKIIKTINRTVLLIDHKLENLIFFDKVLVVDEGKVIEFDTLENLLKNENSFLRKSLYGLENRDDLFDLLKLK